MNVFIVDDSVLVRKKLREHLGELENLSIVGEAIDAAQALELLESVNTDVVILDIRMPNGNGMKVLKDLKARQKSPLVIIYTSFAYPQYRQAYMKAGADYFFEKGKDVYELMRVLSNLTFDRHTQAQP